VSAIRSMNGPNHDFVRVQQTESPRRGFNPCRGLPQLKSFWGALDYQNL
jgi:hypothetical protein